MKKFVFAAIFVGLAAMTTSASASPLNINLVCKFVSGGTVMSSNLQREFCASLKAGLNQSGEVIITPSKKAKRLEVVVTRTGTGSANITINWAKSKPLILSMSSFDSGMKPFAAQGLVLPVLKLIRGN
jgi:hypothetical protein